MRQTHPAGERLFVDDAGQTVAVIDGATGAARQAQILVAALGASNFTDAEARWTQSLPDWLGCHVGAFAHMGGAARQLVCDNLKSGVTAASRYEPGISRAYQDLASHYGTAVLPARVRRPRGKAIAKRCVPKGNPEGSRLPSRWRNAGFSPGCGAAGSSLWSS